MNTRLQNLIRSPFASASRAQFSPLALRITRRSLRPTTPHRRPTLALLGGRRWATGLLDRLQPELTRYHE